MEVINWLNLNSNNTEHTSIYKNGVRFYRESVGFSDVDSYDSGGNLATFTSKATFLFTAYNLFVGFPESDSGDFDDDDFDDDDSDDDDSGDSSGNLTTSTLRKPTHIATLPDNASLVFIFIFQFIRRRFGRSCFWGVWG